MPILTTSSGLVVLAALLPIAAAPIALSPGEVTAYTLAGALVAAFLAVAYMRMKAPKMRDRFWPLAFTVVSAIFVGWIIPEPLAWWAVRKGVFTGSEIEAMPRQIWAGLGLLWGLSGTTVILTAIYWAQKKLPALMTQEEDLPPIELPDGGRLEIKHTKPAVSENSITQPPA